ncbi:MAG: type II toxin-antitoxin system PemK/MazF family toxin [Methanoregula sp.]|jgi:mRNA interferase MazF|uniref:type II toxin-antitoxin system PemK/MazF family toxin n=1 Tax=Methanoregula sp. TaxID=2052170 RepID=UPI003D13615C
MKGSIILIHFPFTDMSGLKLRPALVIHESNQDVVVAFISSRIPKHRSDSDLLISSDHPSFAGTGLKRPSVIRFDKVATVSRDLIEGGIGEIDEGLARECNAVMSRVFSV